MSKLQKIVSTSVLALACNVVLADAGHQGNASHSPYVDYTSREIKALSAQEVDNYTAGHGMGLALAAELNRYPGPRHVIDLADQLQLNPQQRKSTQQLFEQMQAQAILLGEKIIEQERELDHLFAEQTIDAETLSAKLAAIAKLQGELRNIHLSTHLKMREMLTQHQIHAYVGLRGYADGNHQHGVHH